MVYYKSVTIFLSFQVILNIVFKSNMCVVIKLYLSNITVPIFNEHKQKKCHENISGRLSSLPPEKRSDSAPRRRYIYVYRPTAAGTHLLCKRKTNM